MLSSARKAFLLFSLFSLCFLFLADPRSTKVKAAAPTVVINEIAWMGTGASSNDEWIELYNNSDGEVSLGGWMLLAGDSTPSIAFSADKKIPAHGYFLLERTDDTTVSNLAADQVYTGALGNDGEDLQLRDSGGNLVDRVNATADWFSAGNNAGKATMERIDPEGDGSVASNWSTNDGVTVNGKDAGGNLLKGTPKAQNSVYKITYPTGTFLWEYLPNPLEGNEWVEIYNDNNESKTLSNWQIDDVEGGGASPKTFSVTLSGKGYFKIDLGTTTFFNNDGDKVRLLRPDGSEVEKTSFAEAFKGISFARDDGKNWQETRKTTPGEANVIESPVHGLSLAEIKKLTLGSRVSFAADVTAPPDLLGDNDFYVHDGSAGIKVHCTCELTKDSFRLGDKAKVSSTVEESYEEKYIKTAGVEVLEGNRPQVGSDEIRTGEVGEVWEGDLVRVGGSVEDLEENAFYVNDGTGKVKIYFKDSLGFSRPKVKRGDLISALGLVSQYGFLESGVPNYRVLPRYEGDVEILPVANSSAAGEVLGSVAAAKSDLAAAPLLVVKELPRTGPGEDFYRWGWLVLFASAALRLWVEAQLKNQFAHGEDKVNENESHTLRQGNLLMAPGEKEEKRKEKDSC